MGKKLLFLFIVFVIILPLIISCVSTRTVRYETSARPPKPGAYPLEIYDSVNLAQPYKVIGIVQANAGKLHNPADTLEYLKEEARKIGGDALIDLATGPSAARAITQVGSTYVAGSVREIWTAKVIVWLEE